MHKNSFKSTTSKAIINIHKQSPAVLYYKILFIYIPREALFACCRPVAYSAVVLESQSGSYTQTRYY